jgi:hypothetical protein
MSPEIEKFLSFPRNKKLLEELEINNLTELKHQALKSWSSYWFTLGQHRCENIEAVKYEGRLVILEDGSRWEVPKEKSHITESWAPGEKVAVIDDTIYKLNELESTLVEEDF